MAQWEKTVVTTKTTSGKARQITFYEEGGALMCRVWFEGGDHEAVRVDSALDEASALELEVALETLQGAAMAALGYEPGAEE